jgi:hypothetical protein
MKLNIYFKSLLLILAFLLINIDYSDAQMWKRYRREISGGIGASNILGDLGGADQIGTNFIRDLNYNMTRSALTFGYKYRVAPKFKIRTHLSWALLRASDENTLEPFRNDRNLNVRTNLGEFSLMGEYYFKNEGRRKRYMIQGTGQSFFEKLSPFMFVGVSGMYFNPQGELNGKWYNLQPLGTEGQGISPGKNLYSRFVMAVPVGLGVNYPLTRELSVGFELCVRYTFTDYLDDVSNVYYDNDAIRATRGDIAADLADKSKGTWQYRLDESGKIKAGSQRGDGDDNDVFFTGVFTLSYKIPQKSRFRAKF